MALIEDVKTSNEKIAGHKVPTWAGTDPEDLEAIVNINMQKEKHVIHSEPEVPGRCPKCHNPISKCLCNG